MDGELVAPRWNPSDDYRIGGHRLAIRAKGMAETGVPFRCYQINDVLRCAWTNLAKPKVGVWPPGISAKR